tara:strand:+ start:201 stop:386 length:186 start_codon:yes stop_codon:yes gene_type:complete
MEFRKKTSSRFSSGLINFLIKFIIFIFVFLIIIFLLGKVDLPAPYKNINKKVPNDNFKIVK